MSGKTKTNDSNIEQNKSQYGLDKKTAKSSENVSKYEFLIGKDVLPQ